MSDRAAPARPWYDLIIETIALKGWSKSTLSEKSGIARSTIDNWQRNSRAPQAAAVNAVADTLGIPRRRANELAGILRTGRESTVPADVLAVIRRNYSPEEQRQAIELLESLHRDLDISEPPEEAESERPGGVGFGRAG